MNQPTKWSQVAYSIFSIFKHTLFIYTNMKNKKLKFNSSLFIEKDSKYNRMHQISPHEFKFTNNSHLTDPIAMYLYKCRIHGTYISSRIFLYRIILKIIQNSCSSSDYISNIKTIINNKNNKNCSIPEKNDNLYKKYYYKNDLNHLNKNDTDDDFKNNYSKKIKIEHEQNELHNMNYNNYYYEKEGNTNINDLLNNDNNENIKNSPLKFNIDSINNSIRNTKKEITPNNKHINEDYNQENIYYHKNFNNKEETFFSNYNKQDKIKYWINNYCYMEMDIKEVNDFMSSCLYHQIIYILKNIISKSIDFFLNQYMYIVRLAKFKEHLLNKPQYFELPTAMSLYQIGILFLSKYIANNGKNDDNYLISLSTNLKELNERLKEDNNENNWYIGKQYPNQNDNNTNNNEPKNYS
eukprot:jgi/Orpsp1_1/1177984/evm.model.c7180000063625.1